MAKPSLECIVGRKIRFALLGCGRISANHVSALGAHRENAALVAVCDSDPKALGAVAEATGVTGFSNLSDVLAHSDADIIAITTPSGLHADQAVEAAAAGRHIMTEKPMATRWEDGKRMVRACDEAGVRLFVVKQN